MAIKKSASGSRPLQRGGHGIVCPHCEAVQSEPKDVISTFCRSCNQHISVVRATDRKRGLLKFGKRRGSVTGQNYEEVARDLHMRATGQAPGSLSVLTPETDQKTPAPKPPHLEEQTFKEKVMAAVAKRRSASSRNEPRSVSCISCSRTHTVPGIAQSTLCPGCGTSIVLRDFDIQRPCSLPIETRGNVVVGRAGSANSVQLSCHNLDVEGGKIAGKIRCSGDFNFEGNSHVTGGITCRHLHVQLNSDLRSIHPIVAASVYAEGTIAADIQCSGTIVIGPKGLLRGDVLARSVQITPGGSLEGSTQIVNPSHLPKGSKPTLPPALLAERGEEVPNEELAVALPPEPKKGSSIAPLPSSSDSAKQESSP